jgi:hypothetical protein
MDLLQSASFSAGRDVSGLVRDLHHLAVDQRRGGRSTRVRKISRRIPKT